MRNIIVNDKKHIHIFAILAIVVVSLIGLHNYNMPVILNDEFGYWSNAELLVRGNWIDLAKETPYYSMGYSLVLVPILYLFKTYSLAYHVAIVMNTLFLVIEYLCAVYILRAFDKTSNTLNTALQALCAILLCSNIFHVRVGWCETFLTMLLWISTALIVSIERNYKAYKISVLYVVILLSYLTHQRSIGIIGIALLVLCCLLIKKKKIGALIFIILASVLILRFQVFVKDFQNGLIDNDRVSELNEVAFDGNLLKDKIGIILSRIPEFIMSFFGKIYIAFFISLGVITIGVKNYIIKLVQRIKNKSKSELFTSESFIVLLALAMIALSVVQIIGGTRKDEIVYSRYMEFSFGPLILISISYFCRDIEKNLKAYLLGFAGFVVLSPFVYREYITRPLFFNNPCSPIAGGLFELYGKDESSLIIVSIEIFVLFIAAIFLVLRSERGRKNICKIVCCIMLAVNLYSGMEMSIWLRGVQQEFYAFIKPMKKEIEKHECIPVYFLKDDENYLYSANAKYLQVTLEERPIHVIEDIDEIESDEYFLLTNPRFYPVPYNCKYSCASSFLILYEKLE